MIPTYLTGPPGIGKTALAYALGRNDATALALVGAKPAEREVIYLPLAERDPMEIAGASYLDKGVCRWAPSESMQSATSHPSIIILDELTAAHRVQRVAALRYADPSAGLHPQTIVIATGNSPEYAAGAGDPLTAPEISRFRVVQRDQTAAVRWMCAQHGEVGRVGQFLRAQPRAALASTEAMAKAVSNQSPFATPRGWTRCAQSGLSVDDWDGVIGADGPAQYTVWLTEQDLPDPTEILAGKSLVVPERPDSALAVATAVVERLGESGDPAAVEAAIAWIDAASHHHAGIISPEADILAARYMHQCYRAAKKGLLSRYARVQEVIARG